MPIIALVRHGQASFGAADYDELSPLGRRQAELVGVELGRRRLRDPWLLSGRLRRQQDTARLLAAAAGIPDRPRLDGRWDEYDHLGLLRRYVDPARVDRAGQDQRAFQRLLDEALTAWADDPDPGWAEFRDAGVSALRELAADLPAGRDAVVVTSGGVLAALAAALLEAPLPTMIALNRVAVNAAITTVVVGRMGVHLMSFNEHAHVAGEQRALLTHR